MSCPLETAYCEVVNGVDALESLGLVDYVTTLEHGLLSDRKSAQSIAGVVVVRSLDVDRNE